MLWRVWRNGRYKLVEAESRDAVYRRFKKSIREEITRVDEVRPSSYHRARKELCAAV